MNLNKASVVDAIAKIFPRAKDINARDAFNEAMSNEQGSPVRMIFLVAAKKFLEEGGHDVESNKPYVDVLKLKGGKAEFDALDPR